MASLGAAGLAGITLNLATSILTRADLIKRLRSSQRDIKQQLEEMDVLRLILEETGKQFLSSGRASKAAEAATYVCQARFGELSRLMDKFTPEEEHTDIEKQSKKGVKMNYTASIKAHYTAYDRKLALQAFRDSVLLLRDLRSR
ncbi:hypothetical protein H2199_005815 [Coniosporium tulheliwenetii]|uniref:Uncharacterized protein n=1 Tax=Coniosporium tulheliwenetii TaxID=3383036 RepID=A0ACC2YXW4_9PEZI|nr:hypothetical protein H2199_005815 [Cladosporium sp. JES 115]